MQTKALTAILTLVNLVLVQGSDSNITIENPDHNSTRRILNGSPAVVSDFPFLVKLHIATAIGAGAIVADQWILTAGHCLYQRACSEEIEIFPATWSTGESVKPAECHTHPQFSEFSNAYDLGLIKVSENLVQDGRAKAAPLPAPGTVYPPGTSAIIAGWGVTETEEVPETLLRGDFRVEEWDYCNNKNQENSCHGDPECRAQDIPRRILCLQGVGDPSVGSCFGDSGGPAMINGEVAGIVSFGISDEKKCIPGTPSMHVTVADYLPWIYSFIAPEMDTSGIQVSPEYP